MHEMGNIVQKGKRIAWVDDQQREFDRKIEIMAQSVERRLDRKNARRRSGGTNDIVETAVWAVRAVPARRRGRYHTQLTGSEHRVIKTNATCASRVLFDANHDLCLAGAHCIGVLRDPETNVVVELVYECRDALSILAAVQ